MNELPLRSLSVSDFRRLEGHRSLPLDAQIVLLHGPNGTGKTSVLSALELALTGEIRSMRRHDSRYTAHLPFRGQEFATVRAEVSDALSSGIQSEPMTVGGSRVTGTAALKPADAQFYGERCYLDQAALGRLPELYQDREGSGESALALFVNELLGREQLDALRAGLSDSLDVRRLRKLSEAFASAEAEEQRAGNDLSRAAEELQGGRDYLRDALLQLTQALQVLGMIIPAMESSKDWLAALQEQLGEAQPAAERSAALDLNEAVTRLEGRLQGALNRPSIQRVEVARTAVTNAQAAFDQWSEQHGDAIAEWRTQIERLGLSATSEEAEDLGKELRLLDADITQQAVLAVSIERSTTELAEHQAALAESQAQLSSAQEVAGSLVEGLTVLRAHASDGLCPVCERDFSEVSAVHLGDHMDQKIATLTTLGAELRLLRQQRDAAAAQAQTSQRSVEQLAAQRWSTAASDQVSQRRSVLSRLQERQTALEPAVAQGRALASELGRAQADLEEAEAAVNEEQVLRGELESLGGEAPAPDKSLLDLWRTLADRVHARLQRAEELHRAHTVALESLERASQLTNTIDQLRETVSDAAERKSRWESRVREARRRQAVAKAVHEAASMARATIVQRVFTQSLNAVWGNVFARLAPREGYVPRFGIPTSSKTALELTIQTMHRSGAEAGPPQTMLSAGNLNTAALSLFIALHLAVEPRVPCLVFDDPVQSMDEVHIAQFAGLVRVLAKHHERQVIIAVHERELFEYLSLELSPAFQGDELITIELGRRAEDVDEGVRRISWSPDPAIAV